MKPNLIITISRQLGAGGAFIGQQVARRLDLHYADREIIRKAAKQLSVREEDIEIRDEKTLPFWETLVQSTGYAHEFYVPINIQYAPTDAEMYAAETNIIRKIAEKGSAVIIGRCGFHILAARPNTLRVFLHADAKFRAERVMELYKMNRKDAELAVEESDRERSKYITAFTGLEWKNTSNFDLTIDTGKLGLENSIEGILSFVNLWK